MNLRVMIHVLDFQVLMSNWTSCHRPNTWILFALWFKTNLQYDFVMIIHFLHFQVQISNWTSCHNPNTWILLALWFKTAVQYYFVVSDDRFDKQSSTPYFLCKRTMSATPFDPLTTVNSFDASPKRYDATGVDCVGTCQQRTKKSSSPQKMDIKFVHRASTNLIYFCSWTNAL